MYIIKLPHLHHLQEEHKPLVPGSLRTACEVDAGTLLISQWRGEKARVRAGVSGGSGFKPHLPHKAALTIQVTSIISLKMYHSYQQF